MYLIVFIVFSDFRLWHRSGILDQNGRPIFMKQISENSLEKIETTESEEPSSLYQEFLRSKPLYASNALALVGLAQELEALAAKIKRRLHPYSTKPIPLTNLTKSIFVRFL